jgi:hypothetical protein
VSEPINIRKIIEELIAGRMRVPNFQRGFVWDPERVAYLMDSIYKGYPFGSILLWRTKQELSHERNLGPFNLPQNDPEYPTDYILDGQQRITSIFGVFQTDIVLNEPPLWSRIFYDFGASENAQESSFTCFSRRYNSQPVKNLKEDVIAFGNLKAGKNKGLTDHEMDVGAAFFTTNVFRINSVLSRTFVLMLAQNRPTSFISGNTIDLRKTLKAYNRHEFHHIYPLFGSEVN